jgi:hypothetical protein
MKKKEKEKEKEQGALYISWLPVVFLPESWDIARGKVPGLIGCQLTKSLGGVKDGMN